MSACDLCGSSDHPEYERASQWCYGLALDRQINRTEAEALDAAKLRARAEAAEKERDEAKLARDDWHRTADLRSGEIIRLETQRDAPMGGYGVPSGPMREFYPRVIARLEAQVAQLTAALREAAERIEKKTGYCPACDLNYSGQDCICVRDLDLEQRIRALSAPASAPQAEHPTFAAEKAGDMPAPEALRALATYVASDSAVVREGAVLGLGRVLARIAESDPSPGVRTVAADALDAAPQAEPAKAEWLGLAQRLARALWNAQAFIDSRCYSDSRSESGHLTECDDADEPLAEARAAGLLP